MRKFLIVILCSLVWGCTPTVTFSPAPEPTPFTLATLPPGCTTPGEVLSAELPQPSRGYAYSYRVYLPPCYSAEGPYPVLYLIPGRGSSPESWLQAGLSGEMDRLILSGWVSPRIVVITESTNSDPNAETIYEDLIPFIESQYSVPNAPRYRAVAGGSLGGIAAYRLAFQHPDTFSSAGMFGAGAIQGEEPQIRIWLSRMSDENRVRVFLNSGEGDPFMLERARVMKTILDEAGVENELYVDQGEHHYTYWIPNFERFLAWIEKDE